MSEELKTLKDMELCDWHINDVSAKRTLKAEAVKWVKYHRDLIIGNEKDKKFIFCNGWIITFFNLTEEDDE
ncbi:MAG: hypothetical protein R3321_02995 [Nitrososphaeraceae archaeon]|nr:hypothetical protein [Nitrososphaeraceae archaeon]